MSSFPVLCALLLLVKINAFPAPEQLGIVTKVTSATAWALAVIGSSKERDTSSPPKISTDWVADVLTNRSQNGSQIDINAVSILAQEMSQQRRVLMRPQRMPIAPLEWVGTAREWLNTSTFELPNLVVVSFNGNEYKAASPPVFSDLFSFLQVATYAGEVSFKGRLADRWIFELANTHLEAFIDKAGMPLLLTQAFDVKGVETYAVSYEFLNFRAGEKAPELWSDFNASHATNPVRCPASTDGTQTTDMFIFHPKDNFDIAGQDLADLGGDTAFVCLDVTLNQSHWTDHNYTWLTKWEIEHLPTWGQYANCNGYPSTCLGSETFYPGHEAAYYLGSESSETRQCGKNEEMGEWYSLPIAGECKDGSAPSEGVCSWRRQRRVKTIDGKCLIDQHHFRDICLKDARAPFSSARKVFQAAFESDDIAKGGCPPIATLSDSEEVFV